MDRLRHLLRSSNRQPPASGYPSDREARSSDASSAPFPPLDQSAQSVVLFETNVGYRIPSREARLRNANKTGLPLADRDDMANPLSHDSAASTPVSEMTTTEEIGFAMESLRNSADGACTENSISYSEDLAQQSQTSTSFSASLLKSAPQEELIRPSSTSGLLGSAGKTTSSGKRGKVKNRSREMADRGFEGPFDSQYWRQVKDKEELEGLPRKLAIREARLDRIIDLNGGSAEKGLYFTVINAQSQGEACQLIEGIIARGVDLGSKEDFPNDNPLHVAAKRNFFYVSRLLLDNDVPTDTLSNDNRLAVQIALDEKNDDLAALLMRKMSKASVRKLFESQVDDGKPCFNYQYLLQSGCMPTACRAVLDACIEPTDEPDEYRFHYKILEADQNGQTPNSPSFNPNAKTAFHRILETEDKELLHHYVLRMIIHNKWIEYGERRAWINLGLYLLFLLTFTLALAFAVVKNDPREYTTTKDYVRAVLEICAIIGILVNFFEEVGEMRREGMNYLRDPYNYLQMASMVTAVLIIPFRWVNSSSQWHLACLAYILLALRVLKLISVTRVVGIYLQILTRILIKDLTSFCIIFTIFLLTYSGALMLALRGEQLSNPPRDRNGTILSDPIQTTKLAVSKLTNSYPDILLTGIRTMIQQENVASYIAEDGDDADSFGWLGIAVNMVFLFLILVVLLNILIAQLSDTYAAVKADALRELEMNWGLALKNLEQGPLKRKRLKNYDPFEDVEHPAGRLLGWEEPTSDGGQEEEQRRQRQMEQHVTKQQQQIMALKSQMRTTLEMLRRNEKEPPRLHGAVDVLGTQTIPTTMKTIVNSSESSIISQLVSAREKNEEQLTALNKNMLQSTSEVTGTLKQSQGEVIASLTERLVQMDREVQLVKDALAESIPQAVGGIIGRAHESSVRNLSEQLSESKAHVSLVKEAVQEQLPLAMQAMMSQVQMEILCAVRDVSQQVPRLVEEMVQHSQTEVLTTLSRRLDSNTVDLCRDVVTQVEGQLNQRQAEMYSKLDGQLATVLGRISDLPE